MEFNNEENGTFPKISTKCIYMLLRFKGTLPKKYIVIYISPTMYNIYISTECANQLMVLERIEDISLWDEKQHN